MVAFRGQGQGQCVTRAEVQDALPQSEKSIRPQLTQWTLRTAPSFILTARHAHGRGLEFSLRWQPSSVADSFLFLLIEGVVGFYSCDHLGQW